MNAFATSAVVTLALIAMEAAKRHVRYRIKIKSIKTNRHEKSVWTCQRNCASDISPDITRDRRCHSLRVDRSLTWLFDSSEGSATKNFTTSSNQIG
jgi:hypothetical protein